MEYFIHAQTSMEFKVYLVYEINTNTIYSK